MKTYPIKISVNGEWRETKVTARDTLLDALREKIGAFELKNGCGQGDCGACTVILDGKAVNACLTLALQANGKQIVTLKGIGSAENPHPLQKAFVEHGAIQCGFCTPGMVVSAKSLLDRNPNPSRQEIREGLAGNLCRCTGYTKIVEAVEDASAKGQS
jgi:aerobic-type carbon monoxide dehydrogenase small subunit (CoxS/CutS family)